MEEEGMQALCRECPEDVKKGKVLPEVIQGEIKRREGEAVGKWKKMGTSLKIIIKDFDACQDPPNVTTHAH